MPLHEEDRAFAARMLAGDEAAFAEFVERYPPALYRFAQARLGADRELVRDTVQIAITKALAKLESYRGDASLLTWLCACCRNEILMHRRRLRTAPEEVELDDYQQPAPGAPVPRPDDPEAALLRRESARLVHITLDLLPGHYARALEWKYVEKLPVSEIGARLGLGSKAAESVLTRAREAFRRRYAGVLDPPVAVAAATDGVTAGGAGTGLPRT